MAESAVVSRLNWDKGNRIYNKGNRFIMPYTQKLGLQDCFQVFVNQVTHM